MSASSEGKPASSTVATSVFSVWIRLHALDGLFFFTYGWFVSY